MTKKQIFKLVFVLLILINLSCKDDVLPTDNNKEIGAFQVRRIYNPRLQLVSDTDLELAENLFQTNSLSLSSNLQVFSVDTNVYSTGTKAVGCFQFYQGLKIFNHTLIFWFNGHNQYTSLTGYLYTYIPMDTIPSVRMKDASSLFINRIRDDGFYKDSLNIFMNYGFNAELGIYDLSTVNDTTEHFVLAWEITIVKSGKFPRGYIRADSLYLVYYDNGIIFR